MGRGYLAVDRAPARIIQASDIESDETSSVEEPAAADDAPAEGAATDGAGAEAVTADADPSVDPSVSADAQAQFNSENQINLRIANLNAEFDSQNGIVPLVSDGGAGEVVPLVADGESDGVVSPVVEDGETGDDAEASTLPPIEGPFDVSGEVDQAQIDEQQAQWREAGYSEAEIEDATSRLLNEAEARADVEAAEAQIIRGPGAPAGAQEASQALADRAEDVLEEVLETGHDPDLVEAQFVYERASEAGDPSAVESAGAVVDRIKTAEAAGIEIDYDDARARQDNIDEAEALVDEANEALVYNWTSTSAVEGLEEASAIRDLVVDQDGQINVDDARQSLDPSGSITQAGLDALNVDPEDAYLIGALEDIDYPTSELERGYLIHLAHAQAQGTISVGLEDHIFTATDSNGQPIYDDAGSLTEGGNTDRYAAHDADGQLVQIRVDGDPAHVRVEPAGNGNVQVIINGASNDLGINPEESFAQSRVLEFENPGAIEIIGEAPTSDGGSEPFVSEQHIFHHETGEAFARAVLTDPIFEAPTSVAYYGEPAVPEGEVLPLVVQYERNVVSPGEQPRLNPTGDFSLLASDAEIELEDGVLRHPETRDAVASYQSPQATQLALWMATDAEDDWRAAATDAVESGRFEGATVDDLLSYDNPQGVQLLMETAASQGAAEAEAFREQLIADGVDPEEADTYAAQLERQYVVSTLNTAMTSSVTDSELAAIEANASAQVEAELGLSPGDPDYDVAFDGARLGLLMVENGPVLDGYAAFYANETQSDYEAFIADGGTLDGFVEQQVIRQGLSPSRNPLEFSVIQNTALANDSAITGLSPEQQEAFFEYPWDAYTAANGTPPQGWPPPDPALLAAYDATEATRIGINEGVINGWRAQHDAFVDSWLGEGGALDQIDAENGGIIADTLLDIYEGPVPIPLLGGVPGIGNLGPSFEDIFGNATSKEEVEAVIRGLDTEMQAYFDSLDPTAMSGVDLISAETDFENQFNSAIEEAGPLGEAYARSLGYANVGGEIVKTVGVVGASLLTFTGIGTGPGVAALAAIGVGATTRVGLDAFDRLADGESYDLGDAQNSALRGAVDASTAVVSYIGAAHAFRAAHVGVRGLGLSDDTARFAGRLAGFTTETAIDGGINAGHGLATGQSRNQILFNVGLSAGLNAGFSTVLGFDYDSRIVNRTFIQEGPQAGQYRMTLADGSERFVPAWAADLQAQGQALDPFGWSPGSRADSLEAVGGITSWLEDPTNPEIGRVGPELFSPDAEGAYIVVGQASDPDTWRLVDVTRDADAASTGWDLTALGRDLRNGDEILGSVHGGGEHQTTTGLVVSPADESAALGRELAATYGDRLSPTFYNYLAVDGADGVRATYFQSNGDGQAFGGLLPRYNPGEIVEYNGRLVTIEGFNPSSNAYHVQGVGAVPKADFEASSRIPPYQVQELVREHESLERARNQALDEAGDLGFDQVASTARLGPAAGQIHGFSSADGLRGFRIDFDPERGIHYNWYDWTDGPKGNGGRWGAEFFPGTEEDYLRLIAQMNNRG